MIKWLNQEVIPATYKDLNEAAKDHGKLRVYSVERRTGSRVTEVYQKPQQIVPIFDGSLEERQKLIREIRRRRELKQGWGLVNLIINYLVRQQQRAIK